ncbi:MAG: Fic family protein [Chitinophagales bacterium]|nr:Fic family protein [Chitinophagales bacterium]
MDKKLRFDFPTTQKIINKIGFIDSFKGKWLAIEKEENRYLKELRKIATIQSIGSSTRIEGATLSNEEVETLLANIKINKLETRDEQEVFGYYDALEVILENYSEIGLNESNIFNLHNLLLKYSGKDQTHKGKYKQLSNKVVATYPGGKQRIIFNTTEPYLVKKEMDDLIVWVNENLQSNEIHPLIIIGAFVYEFLSIHPFQDGNGRLSRLFTTLLLMQTDYPFIQYVSFENHIEKEKQRYYQVLMDAQKHRYSENEIIDKWMIFFLESLEILIQKLEEKYSRYKSKGPYLNERQRTTLDFIRKNEPVKTSDVAEFMKQESIHTIKKDMLYLHREGVIEKIGKGKATIYLIKENSLEEE